MTGKESFENEKSNDSFLCAQNQISFLQLIRYFCQSLDDGQVIRPEAGNRRLNSKHHIWHQDFDSCVVSVWAFIKVVLVFLRGSKYNVNCQVPQGIHILGQTIRSLAF